MMLKVVDETYSPSVPQPSLVEISSHVSQAAEHLAKAYAMLDATVWMIAPSFSLRSIRLSQSLHLSSQQSPRRLSPDGHEFEHQHVSRSSSLP